MAEYRRTAKPWPWPGDTREDKAKRVALSYRGILQRITQGACEDPAGDLHRMDEHWAQLGVHWPRPRPDLLIDNEDEWMSAPDLADALDRDRRDIYNWARLGHIEQRAGPDGAPEYSVSSVVAYNTKLRQRRIKNQRREN